MSTQRHRPDRTWRLLALAGICSAYVYGGAAAQTAAPPRISDGVVKIGLILDMSGPYSDTAGAGSVTAAKMAVEDFGGTVLGAPIEVVAADHGNSPDRAAEIARGWFGDQHVDAIMDVSGSSEALIVQAIANTRNKIILLSSAGAQRLSGEGCTATSIHYVFDTASIARTAATSLLKQGERSWFFITADYSFGYDLESDTAAVVTAGGGQVLGRARHPFGATDFQSYLARAHQSGAQAVALANAGADTDNAIKQAAKLDMLSGGQLFVPLGLRINGIDSLGLKTTQGMAISESFYWDLDDATRAWSERFFQRVHKMPNSLQAGVYSSTMHYLKAIAKAGTDDTGPVMQAMRDTPVNDFFAHNGYIRGDGVMVHDVHLFRVKGPSETQHAWDYYRLVATVPGDEAFALIGPSRCPLLQSNKATPAN
ncbi:MAG: ABC transporter substrate-binding protein [Alphaproteobacteria bacterium]|nr:ABC transporter substrate-binding protein [Alphaproteobacteria bacterium]